MKAAIWIAIWLAIVGGWVANVVKLIGLVGGAINAEVVIRVAGVFLFPLGVFMGWV